MISDMLYSLANWLDNMTNENNYYSYKGNVYYCHGLEKDSLSKIKNPDTGEWFDAVSYAKVRFFTDEEGNKYYRTYGGDTFYREVEDFKKKFKKYPKSRMKDIKELW